MPSCLPRFIFLRLPLGAPRLPLRNANFPVGPSLIRGQCVWVLRALGNLHMFTDLDLATPIRQYVGEYTHYHFLGYRVSLTPSSLE